MTRVLVLSSLSRIREIGNNRALDYCPGLGDAQLQPTPPIPGPTLRWYGVDLAESQALKADIEEVDHE
tara:strand:+ start:1968 stop:2171 length:204 start_codon:yes stop_codon:yes gene_type:complete